MTRIVSSALGLAAAAALFGCLPVSRDSAAEAISITRNPRYGICRGICPSYTITVSANGEVLAQEHWTKRSTRFQVTAADADRFRSLLRPYRPIGSAQAEPVCNHDLRPEDAPFVQKVREIEIVWSDPPQASRLIACDTPAISEMLRQALWSVHLNQVGTRQPN